MIVQPRLTLTLLLVAALLSACDQSPEPATTTQTSPQGMPDIAQTVLRGNLLADWTPHPDAPAALPKGQSGQLVIRAVAGGSDPASACEPAIFLSNETTSDLHAAVIKYHWDLAGATIASQSSPAGALVVRLGSGQTAYVAHSTLKGACRDLRLTVDELTCRDGSAKAGACPGTLKGEALVLGGVILP